MVRLTLILLSKDLCEVDRHVDRLIPCGSFETELWHRTTLGHWWQLKEVSGDNDLYPTPRLVWILSQHL